MKVLISEQIKSYAQKNLGVDLIGICSSEKLITAEQQLNEFIDNGYHGEMKYLENNSSSRTDPEALLPGAKSIIVIAINYYREKPATPDDHGRIARYAWGRDYHKVFRKILKQFIVYLEQNWPNHQHRPCVDTAPILEKAFAEKAGIGFYGKNTTLISPQIGSFFLLGEIITTLDLQPDQPGSGSCGTCRRCLDACPTQALLAPGKMDARRCISYQTLESKTPIPEEIGAKMSNLIAGCDICQEVCPYNIAHAKPLKLEALQSVKIAGDSIPLLEIFQLSNTEEFLKRFAGSPLTRPKRTGLIKNALNAAQNSIRANPDLQNKLIPAIKKLSEEDQSEFIRNLAAQSIVKING